MAEELRPEEAAEERKGDALEVASQQVLLISRFWYYKVLIVSFNLWV